VMRCRWALAYACHREPGTVNAACANVTVSGHSHDVPFINGMLIGWQVTLAGSGTAIVNDDPSGAPPDKGSVLLE
jgi:hypothetical protein